MDLISDEYTPQDFLSLHKIKHKFGINIWILESSNVARFVTAALEACNIYHCLHFF